MQQCREVLELAGEREREKEIEDAETAGSNGTGERQQCDRKVAGLAGEREKVTY
jgi:hypothetical protein